jgi:G3E family GTPase
MSTNDPAEKLPVYLLTGFLGSGKTTLLAQWIHQPSFADTAVIVNEFGEIGLDHALLEKSDDSDIMLLDSGCLCCAMNNPLQDCLEDLYYRRLRTEIAPFGRVIVETSGLADPGPLVNTLMADPSVAAHYRFGGVITCVDAVHGLHALASFREAATQLALADRIVLTKIDLAAQAELEAILAAIARHNPFASLIRSPAPDTHAVQEVLKNLQAHDIRLEPDDQGTGNRTTQKPASRFSHLFRYGISSHVLRVDAPVTWPRYAAWVTAMQRELGEKLLRVKGILSFDDGHIYAIHGVHHLFSPPQSLAGNIPDRALGTLVVIAQDTSENELLRILPLLNGSSA